MKSNVQTYIEGMLEMYANILNETANIIPLRKKQQYLDIIDKHTNIFKESRKEEE